MADRFLTIEDLGNLPEPRWLIEGLFEQDGLVMLVGPPGSFKSFLAIDWALSLATGRPWNGHATKPSKVLYALGEGKANLLKRIQAWIHYNRLSNLERVLLNANFRATFDVPQLAVPRSTKEFIEALDIEGFKPNLFVIDTLARSYVGKDENGQLDSGIWVDSVDKLRQRGMTVLVVHHTKKNTEFGLKDRGSGVFMGAMDTAFILQRNPDGMKGYAKLYCTKQKDHAEPEDIWLINKHIKSDPNAEGSIVLVKTSKPGEDEAIERATREAEVEEMILNLLADSSFASDRARARELANKSNMLETAAHSRIHRARKKYDERSE